MKPSRRDGEDLVSQDLSVGGHDAKIRPQRRQLLEERRVLEALRLQDRHAGRGGHRLDRGIENPAGPGRAGDPVA